MAPSARSRAHLRHRQRRRAAGAAGSSSAGPRRLISPEPREVRRVAAERAEQRRDERVLVGCAQQRVGGPLPADRGGALGAGRGGAERSRAVGRPHRGRRRAASTSRCSERYWARASSSVAVGAEQVGAGSGADDQRAAGEHPERRVAVAAAGRTGARRCGRAWPARAGSARPGRPRRRRRRPRCSNARSPGCRGQHLARRRRRRAARAPERKSACRWVSAANRIRNPAFAAAARTARRSRGGSTTSAPPSPRSTR